MAYKMSEELFNLIYPVGSIYMSVNSANPSTLFGGSWEALENRMLIGAGDSYTAGTTGGSATHTPVGNVGYHTLTVSEIPSHSHTYLKPNSTTGSHVLTINEIPAHDHTTSGVVWGDSVGKSKWGTRTYSDVTGTDLTVNKTGGGQGHTHTISTTSTDTYSEGEGNSHNHTFSGTSQNTMPPYLTVYMWKRTA